MHRKCIHDTMFTCIVPSRKCVNNYLNNLFFLLSHVEVYFLKMLEDIDDLIEIDPCFSLRC
jgi:hypothetical protein